MEAWQVERILGNPEKYLDGALRINACVAYDHDPGNEIYPEWEWQGDGWYEEGALTDIREDTVYAGQFLLDLELDGGGQAEGYGEGDVEIIDERFPELLDEEFSPAPLPPSASTPSPRSTATSTTG
jgi:hypothetical protein